MAAGGQAAGCRDGPVVAGPLPGYEDQVRDALRLVIADFGDAALSSPQTISEVLDDLLPDAPAEKALLVAAAEANLAGQLRELLHQGMDANTAARLAAFSFASATTFTAGACSWAADAFAEALGAALAPAAEPARRTRRSLRSSTLTRAHGPRAKLTSRLPLPAAEELSAAWQALETTGWQVYANVVLPDGQYLRLTARAELREFADHLESLSGGAAGREGGPAVSVQVRAAKTLQRRHTTLSAVVTVFHLGWRTPQDGALADNALHDLITQLTARRHRVRWRKDRPSPPPPG